MFDVSLLMFVDAPFRERWVSFEDAPVLPVRLALQVHGRAGGFATVPLAAWDCWEGRAGHLAVQG